MLGKGGCDTAYKAVLDDGSVVAVKRLRDAAPASASSKKEFVTQPCASQPQAVAGGTSAGEDDSSDVVFPEPPVAAEVPPPEDPSQCFAGPDQGMGEGPQAWPNNSGAQDGGSGPEEGSGGDSCGYKKR